MKNIIKKTALFIITALLMLSFVPQIAAKAIYVVGGYSYTIINDETISLCGWDYRTPGLNVPDSIANRYVAEISDNAFNGDTNLTSVNFEDAVRLKTIGRYAFADCTSLTGEVVIPESVTIMQISAFQGCSSLESVVINAGISTVYNQTFYKCTSLSSVTLNDNITTIREYAFADCPNLTYLAIPESVTQIYNSSFENDTNLTLGVWFGSYGYEYAQSHNIPYVLLDGALLGDANGDGYVNVNDVTEIQRHAAELELLEGINFHAADINGDGNVSVDDATELQRFLAEYVVDYPIGEVMTQ